MHIPYYRPYLTGKEKSFIETVLQSGQLAGDGAYTKKVKTLLEEKYQYHKVLLTTSGTHALEMAMLLVDLAPGDEVIMPSYTFPSTANAVLLRGATPVFAEVDPLTLNLDPVDLERKITSKTKAIVPVHYAGIGCEMERINAIAAKYDLIVIEDAAQAIHAKFKERYLGAWGHLGCLSFHNTKVCSAGEGGALILNGSMPEFEERAEILLQKGTNRHRFLRGEVDKYTWVDLGSSYTPSEILMALLYAQLEEVEAIVAKRQKIHDYYSKYLRKYAKEGQIRITTVPEGCQSNYHLFYLLFTDEATRERVKDALWKEGIEAVIHYIPLHSSPMGQTLGYRAADLPITEQISRTLLRLPMSTGITEVELDYVVTCLQNILEVEQ